MISKSQAIRDALAAIGKPATLDELCPKIEELIGGMVSGQKIRDLCAFLSNKGELVAVGKSAERTRALAPAGKRPKVKKPVVTTIAQIARKHVAEPAPVSVGTLHERHVSTTLSVLESVIDLEGCDPQVLSALASHKEAIALAIMSAAA